MQQAQEPSGTDAESRALPALHGLGWTAAWAAKWEASGSTASPGRVVRAGRLLEVRVEGGSALVECPEELPERPACGDWVLVALHSDSGEVLRGRVVGLLPRSNSICRRAVGFEGPQVLAANVDEVWLVCGLDGTRGLRSLPRYQALSRLDHVTVTVVLNKADLSADLSRDVARAQALAPGLAVVPISALHCQGLAPLVAPPREGRTLVLLGPSGAGKSTLINALCASSRQLTQAVRPGDGRGRHTTSASELFRAQSGALVIDSPGLRELGLWQTAGLDNSFSDILELAAGCRFRDCRHEREPGCNVRHAQELGLLSPERLQQYLDLARESATRATLVKGRKRRYPPPLRGGK